MSGNKYRCILTNYYGDTISNAMTLTVNIKLVVGELELRKDTTTGAIYDVDIWTKSVIHVKLIPGVGGTTTYMSLAGSAQTVEETTEKVEEPKKENKKPLVANTAFNDKYTGVTYLEKTEFVVVNEDVETTKIKENQYKISAKRAEDFKAKGFVD